MQEFEITPEGIKGLKSIVNSAVMVLEDMGVNPGESLEANFIFVKGAESLGEHLKRVRESIEQGCNPIVLLAGRTADIIQANRLSDTLEREDGLIEIIRVLPRGRDKFIKKWLHHRRGLPGVAILWKPTLSEPISIN